MDDYYVGQHRDAELARLREAGERLLRERDEWKRRAEEAEAAAGVMREALYAVQTGESCWCGSCDVDDEGDGIEGEPHSPACRKARAALASDTGKKRRRC